MWVILLLYSLKNAYSDKLLKTNNVWDQHQTFAVGKTSLCRSNVGSSDWPLFQAFVMSFWMFYPQYIYTLNMAFNVNVSSWNSHFDGPLSKMLCVIRTGLQIIVSLFVFPTTCFQGDGGYWHIKLLSVHFCWWRIQCHWIAKAQIVYWSF